MIRRTAGHVVLAVLLAAAGAPAGAGQSSALKAMVLTGQNNHGWQVLSAHYRDILEETGLFDVDVVTTPPRGADMSRFAPDFDSV